MKNEQEKSDPSIVAKRPANKPQIAEVDLWHPAMDVPTAIALGTWERSPRDDKTTPSLRRFCH